jgi:hypothetical protein
LVHPKVVSERLGHAFVALTLDTYSHFMPSLQEADAETLDQILSPRGIIHAEDIGPVSSIHQGS